ncbi:hypothetical protein E4T48_04189 [Aureobasidium sp. EXF-10727]|nr:hypothetical protein E4T48_04189 [Aureobasidium sp. EXF-10727]
METVPISSLSPSSALPSDCGFKALVTLLWPFSSATGQCALLLADPDARQRYHRGQVRVRFTGPCARQIAASGIGIGDSVQVALEGVQWLTESDTALVKTPGRGVDGELIFKNRLTMTITRGEAELGTINVDESTQPTSPKPSMLPPSTPIARSKPRTSFDAYGVAVYSSPAFMKRLRLSEGRTPHSPVPVSEDDDLDTVASRKRRRVSYKNISEWKFDAREPSPEKEQDDLPEDADADEDLPAVIAVPGKAIAETGNVTEDSQDLKMHEAAESVEKADQQPEQPTSEPRSVQSTAAQWAQETVAQDSTVPRSAAENLGVQNLEERVAEAVVQQPAEATSPGETILEGPSQAPESSVTSQTTSPTVQPSALPRLTILPTESELLEQMARAQAIAINRPTTPILQPLLGLPLPSPFPTSAQKMPSPVVPNVADITETALGHVTNTVGSAEKPNLPASIMAEVKESASSPNIVQTDTEVSQQKSDRRVGPSTQTPRIVADTYDGYAEEDPVVPSSGDEDDDEDSESDDASSVYNSEQILALQEQSDDDVEGAVEEMDWDDLERKLEQEEAALQQSREDFTARDGSLVEVADDLEGDEADDAVMHDDDSELDEAMLARSDDDSDDDESDGSGYFDQIAMPDTDSDSQEESEVEVMDRSYQPSMPENAMYSHPFGLDGAQTPTEMRTALPSQAASETGSTAGDENIAWRDRAAAVETLAAQNVPPPLHAPLASSSRLDVVELLDDSDSDGEDYTNVAPVSQEAIDFLPSLDLVNNLLDNKQKDAHLELSGPVTAQIRSEIKNISEQANSPSTKWSKYNALKTICKIGVNVMVAADSGNMFAEGVKYRLKEDEVLVSACWTIYNQLSDVEKHQSGQPPNVLACLEELEEKRDYCFEGFPEFLKQFKQTHYHMPVEIRQQQLHQQSAPMLPKAEAHDVPEVDLVYNAEQKIGPAGIDLTDKMTEQSGQPKAELESQAVLKADVEKDTTAQAGPAQNELAFVEDIDSSQPAVQEEIETQSQTGKDKSEMMDVQATSIKSIDEHEIDPMLLEEDYEIDPALLEEGENVSSSQSQGYEIDPALLEEEREIDPALLAEGHDDLQSNSHPDPLHTDEAMSEASESDAFSVAEDAENDRRIVEEETITAMDESMEDGPLATQTDDEVAAQVREAPLKFEVQQSVEMDPDILEQPRMETTQRQASQSSGPRSALEGKEEQRPLSSSSFKTLSPSPDHVQAQVLESANRSATQDGSHLPAQATDQPIEELDLSQVEPSWTSRLSQFSQSRSSRAHTRSETIPDSADEEATDLEAENNDSSDIHASPEPATQVFQSQGVRGETTILPSQELGTALSQFHRHAPDPSGMQSQLAAIEETPSPDNEGATEEMRSQVGLDDELLADYVQVAPEPTAITPHSKLNRMPSTPTSTKKPARPLTLFRGRKSAGSRLSIGGDEQQTERVDQQIQDGEQQVVQDQVMQEVASQEPQASETIEKVTVATIEGDDQAQNETDASLTLKSSAISDAHPETTQGSQEVIDTASAPAVVQPEPSTAVGKAHEVEQASSDFQIKPTLKPFAEVEASLFGTPVKDQTAAPQEPQSAPSQSWRNTLSSKMSEVPVIGSWFTPGRTTEIQKAATEHKATTSGASFVHDTPTKAAAVSSHDRQKSISPPPLQRYASQGTSTALSYFTPLPGLHQHLNQQSPLIDIVAVCTSATSTAERAKSGPKDYYTTFKVIDQPLHEYNSASQETSEGESVEDVRVEVFRPFKQSLPKASPGDVVLLRGFVVRSRNHKNYLLSTAASGWCVWRYGASSVSTLDNEGQEEEDDRPIWARKGTSQGVGENDVREEVTGPPVEVGEEEREKVAMVRTWWEGLQEKGKGKQTSDHDLIMID